MTNQNGISILNNITISKFASLIFLTKNKIYYIINRYKITIQGGIILILIIFFFLIYFIKEVNSSEFIEPKNNIKRIYKKEK